MWIVVFSLLPCVCVSVCVCVCVLQCLNYLTLRSCLFLSLPYTHFCFAVCVILLFAFQFTLQPCFCFEQSDLGHNITPIIYRPRTLYVPSVGVAAQVRIIKDILKVSFTDSLEANAVVEESRNPGSILSLIPPFLCCCLQ